MGIIKFNQHPGFFTNDFRNMFDNFFGEGWEAMKDIDFSPKTNIVEKEDQFMVSLALPGMKKDDIKIAIEENKLVVSGERKAEERTETDKFHRVEMSYGKFARSFRLPKNINRDAIDAKFEDGMLNLTLPKMEEEKTMQTISIK